MEKIPHIYAVAADMGWSDMGSWSAVFELAPKDGEENVRRGRGVCLDSRRNLILSPEKFVALVGVEGLVVVETEDALLVCSQNRSQDVGKVVRDLKRHGMSSMT